MALVVKNPPANAGDIRDAGLIPMWRRSPQRGHGHVGPVYGKSVQSALFRPPGQVVGDGFVNALKEELKNLLKTVGNIASGEIQKWFSARGCGNVWRHVLVITARETLPESSG